VADNFIGGGNRSTRLGEAKLIATFLFQQLHDYLSEDNNITKTEFISQFTHNSPGLNPIANGLFLEFDMNHDDTITHEDIDKYYMKLDTNGKNTNNTKTLCFHCFVFLSLFCRSLSCLSFYELPFLIIVLLWHLRIFLLTLSEHLRITPMISHIWTYGQVYQRVLRRS
jgi:hypothetical protein